MNSDRGDPGASVKPKVIGGRALKLMGITTTDIIQQCFMPAKSGLMNKSEYQMFWSLMTGGTSAQIENTTIFINEVLTRLLNADPSMVSSTATTLANSNSSASSGYNNNSSYNSSSNSPSGPASVSVESLITTIAFITLMLEFNTSEKQLKNSLEQWRTQTQTGALARAYPAIKDVMRWLTLKCENADMIGPLIISCSTMHSVSEFQRLSDFVLFPSIEESDLKSGEASFLYLFLRRYVLTSKAGDGAARLSSLLSNTYNKMLTLPQQMKVNPKVAETTFCALLHMLTQFLCLGAHTDSAAVRAIVATLQPFYLWPLPYAAMTRDLLLKLQQEAACPGYMLRQRILDEVDTVDVIEGDSVDNNNASSSGLFYFVDAKDEQALSCVQTMELRQIKQDYLPSRRVSNRGDDSFPPLLTPSLQAQIVLNMLANDVGVNESDISALRSSSVDTINNLYRRCINITREVADRPEQARDIRVKSLNAIKQSLKEKGSTSDSVKLPDPCLIPPHTPQLPPLSHLMYARSLNYTFPPLDGKTRTVDFPTSSLYADLASLCDSIASTNKDNKDKTSPLARIIIAGGDELMHHFLCAYMLLKQKQPALAESVRLAFYLVPFNRNGMAAWLARHDSWYLRHVYSPFRSPTFVVPWIKVDDVVNMEEEKNNAIPPVGNFLRSLVEFYARDSSVQNHTHNFHVYQCSAWQYADAREPTCIIPFCQRAEVGVTAVKSMKGSNRDKGSDNYRNDKTDNKSGDDTPPDIIVKFIKMDLSGHVVETVVDDGAPYATILMSSVPRKGDPSFPSSPECPWLELHARLHRTFQKSAVRKNTLVNDPRQHVVEVDLTCVQPSHQFGILLDGQYFGPFHKIKISPVLDEKQGGGKRMKFPVQTFFPIEV